MCLFFIVFGFRQTQPHAFNKLLLYYNTKHKLNYTTHSYMQRIANNTNMFNVKITLLCDQ